MPSLKQLRDFQNSFLELGHESDVLRRDNIRPQEYPIPDTEPTTPSPFEISPDSFDDDLGDMPGFGIPGSEDEDEANFDPDAIFAGDGAPDTEVSGEAAEEAPGATGGGI
ncbi:MAG: hypothetical protein LBT39_04560, partial [Treponema sp.]|nr:hypothetical protein [Treponema sp.]